MWRAATLSAAKPPHPTTEQRDEIAPPHADHWLPPPLPPPWRCRWDNIQPTTATGSRLPLVVSRGGRQLYVLKNLAGTLHASPRAFRRQERGAIRHIATIDRFLLLAALLAQAKLGYMLSPLASEPPPHAIWHR